MTAFSGREILDALDDLVNGQSISCSCGCVHWQVEHRRAWRAIARILIDCQHTHHVITRNRTGQQIMSFRKDSHEILVWAAHHRSEEILIRG